MDKSVKNFKSIEITCGMKEQKRELLSLIETYRKKGLGIEIISEEIVDNKEDEYLGTWEPKAVIPRFQFKVELKFKLPELLREVNYIGCREKKDGIVTYRPVGEERIDKLPVNRCDHCKQNRNRENLYYFRKKESQELIILGSSCVDLYFTADIFSHIKSVYSLVNDCFDDMDESLGGKAKGKTAEVLMAIYKKVYGSGYNKELRDEFYSYLYGDIDIFNSLPWGYKEWSDKQEGEKTPMKYLASLLDPVENYWVNMEPSSTFEANLRETMVEKYQGEDKIRAYVPYKKCLFFQVGISVALKAIEKEKEKEKKRENGIESEWIGKKKERIETTLIFDEYKKIETPFSRYNRWKLLVKFKDQKNSVIVTWYTGSNDEQFTSLEKGQEVKARFTVKSHDEFDGVKQTVVNRVSLPVWKKVYPKKLRIDELQRWIDSNNEEIERIVKEYFCEREKVEQLTKDLKEEVNEWEEEISSLQEEINSLQD